MKKFLRFLRDITIGSKLKVWVFVDEYGRIVSGDWADDRRRKVLVRTRKMGKAFTEEYSKAVGKKVTPVKAKLIVDRIGAW